MAKSFVFAKNKLSNGLKECLISQALVLNKGDKLINLEKIYNWKLTEQVTILKNFEMTWKWEKNLSMWLLADPLITVKVLVRGTLKIMTNPSRKLRHTAEASLTVFNKWKEWVVGVFPDFRFRIMLFGFGLAPWWWYQFLVKFWSI